MINAESLLEADILLTATVENKCISLISTKPLYYKEVMGKKACVSISPTAIVIQRGKLMHRHYTSF